MIEQISNHKLHINIYFTESEYYLERNYGLLMSSAIFESIAARKSSVMRYAPFSVPFLVPWMQIDKSLVIFPSSTVSMQAFSNVRENLKTNRFLQLEKIYSHFWSWSFLSRTPRWWSPLVQAKIDAIGLVEVEFPFWCSL